ncbi:3-hydroxyisobutyrate dehydrogenase-like beta-hydroxyacid dehydrogenase [Chitinophaga dinghuensis]|uniref:3-hydroxyisobutyrate dehydrogenase-like beta-hydroxyacid dehydrogenase n=1 Tax=Chitinophaga dinghuensis TaxID=1539050 RepID=A0A327W2I1_9BACT|nr:NAD(P)-binding domain-containing protein [Chitinophaga dinghuensis]RAJ82244.1 3-hydroxyisobutyrate dehydrogenase-like beta-hydroxyacid dehydrogenase [Chitinophaga dinghuensis]
MENNITLIGLGAMGSVLGELLVKNRITLTVWNRTREKANTLISLGANYVPDIRTAIADSPVILLCVVNYEASREILSGLDLTGKTIIQLSSGTPADAREMQNDILARGAAYLDGVILATPPQMGQPSTPIFFSGDEQVFREQESTLKILAGHLAYMGPAVGAAAAWDLAILSTMFGMQFGFLHGARIMEAEGISVGALGNVTSTLSPVLAEMVQEVGQDIENSRFDQPLSSLEICAYCFELLERHATEGGITAPFPAFGLEQLNLGRAAGFGKERLSAMIKIMR